MKKVFVTISFILFVAELFGQGPLNIRCSTNKNISTIESSDKIPEGADITLIGWDAGYPSYSTTTQVLVYKVRDENGMVYTIQGKDFKNLTLYEPESVSELWSQASLNYLVYENVLKHGMQFGLRKELDEEAIDFVNQYLKYDAIFNDEYLEDYLQSLLFRIHSISLEDGRPGNLLIKVVKSTTPNAFSLPNGMVMITTGLLSLIESEAELIAILAHEISHFVLDHHIQNINEEAARVRRAEFWAGLATLAAAAGEIYLASEYDFIPTGDLTMSAALLSTAIASIAVERLGAKYTRGQETEADFVAGQLLEFLNVDTTAYRSVLVRLRNYAIETGDFGMFLNSGTHLNINERIADAGGYIDPSTFKSKEYNRVVSMATTYTAIEEYNSSHLRSCEELVDRNIESGVATEMDFLLKGMVLRSFADTPENNWSALEYIIKAKELNINNNTYVYKQEAITLLRLKEYDNAIAALSFYLESLESIEEPNNYVNSEIDWTRVMIYKVEQLKKYS